MAVELKRAPWGTAPQVKDLTGEEQAFLRSGGRIQCEVVGGR